MTDGRHDPQVNVEAHPDDEVARFAELPVAVLCDAIDALGLPSAAMPMEIRKLTTHRILGRALTVDRIKAPSNAVQKDIDPELGSGTYRVLDGAEKGTVLVVAAQGDVSVGCVGGNMGARAKFNGMSGLIVDGAVRDLEDFEALGLGIYARGTAPRQAFNRLLTVGINVPVICGGVRVQPGDIIVGDGDGVVAVPKANAAQIAARAEEMVRVEGEMQAFLREGNSLVDAVNTFKQR